jgi:hypothetical protein
MIRLRSNGHKESALGGGGDNERENGALSRADRAAASGDMILAGGTFYNSFSIKRKLIPVALLFIW